MMNKTDKHYISPIDIKLAKFNQRHSKSPAQQEEIKKYQYINQLRDTAQATELKQAHQIWEDF